MKKFILILPILLFISWCSLSWNKPDFDNKLINLEQQIQNLSEQISLLEKENKQLKEDIGKYINPIEDNQFIEESNNLSIEVRKYTPAEIKKIYKKDDNTYFSIDILTHNPDFIPGANNFFLNKSEKLRDVYINFNTKFYICKDLEANVLINTETILGSINNEWLNKNTPNPLYYFDIEWDMVKNIYEQCLP